MKIKTQIAMVLNLDKCIGCHTCSVTCKNVWTSRKGMEYAWWNNVETKPGPGYPKTWEDQEKYRGGWVRTKDGKTELHLGNRSKVMSQLFSNPYLPQVSDYYEPFTFDFSSLKGKRRLKTPPSARPFSMITGKQMDKVKDGPNWEDDLAGTFDERKSDPNLSGIDTQGFEEFERTFMFYVPRLCEHCLHPACIPSCPSGAIYKRKDGVVLINQDRCRGWRQCVSACPYKKIYFNHQRMKSEKCVFCYPRIEDGQPTVCSETCVGRMRYLGVILYDAEKIDDYAAADERELVSHQREMFLDPNDPAVIAEAERQGISHNYILAAQKSPTYKLMKEWAIAFPLHPEYRTLPMVWYVPAMSPKTEELARRSKALPQQATTVIWTTLPRSTRCASRRSISPTCSLPEIRNLSVRHWPSSWRCVSSCGGRQSTAWSSLPYRRRWDSQPNNTTTCTACSPSPTTRTVLSFHPIPSSKAVIISTSVPALVSTTKSRTSSRAASAITSSAVNNQRQRR